MDCKSTFLNDESLELIRRMRELKFAIATTNGCFDLMHIGHVHLLRTCLHNLEIPSRTALIALVNSDASVRAIKGPTRPVYPQLHRLYMVRAIEGVAAAYLFDEETPEKALEKIRPDFHIKGEDWKNKDVPEAKYAKKIIFDPLIMGVSTTATIEKIINTSPISSTDVHMRRPKVYE